MKALLTVFISVFIAELGDKTQLATLLFASNQKMNPVLIFLAASLALVLATLLAVVVGNQLSHYLSPKTLKLIAGMGFIIIGGWILFGNNT